MQTVCNGLDICACENHRGGIKYLRQIARENPEACVYAAAPGCGGIKNHKIVYCHDATMWLRSLAEPGSSDEILYNCPVVMKRRRSIEGKK